MGLRLFLIRRCIHAVLLSLLMVLLGEKPMVLAQVDEDLRVGASPHGGSPFHKIRDGIGNWQYCPLLHRGASQLQVNASLLQFSVLLLAVEHVVGVIYLLVRAWASSTLARVNCRTRLGKTTPFTRLDRF